MNDSNFAMVRLTLKVSSGSEIHLFNKPIIVIGSTAANADLTLSGPTIKPIHLKIINQDKSLVLINEANDPFATVNDQPFGKSHLQSGDLINIEQNTILFELLPSSAIGHNHALKEIKNLFSTNTSPPEEQITLNPFMLSFEGEVNPLESNEWQTVCLDNYAQIPPNPNANSTSSSLSTNSENSQNIAALNDIVTNDTGQNDTTIERKHTVSLKDDYLRYLEDDNQNNESVYSNATDRSHLYQAWKWILVFIFSLLTISAASGTIIYFSVSDKAEAQETKIAQAMADIAMALMHAQMANLIPENQNWSDTDFLKTNLLTILNDNKSHAFHIDAQNQFSCCPYSLRIYTSCDLAHFLLIAQPAPSLLNWLIPKSIVAVDSHLMELRILKDIRALNRLLMNPDPLDNFNGKEITATIKQGEVMSLSTLARDSGLTDFAPPENIAWMRPGSDNFIYAAPRYHRISQTVFQKILDYNTSLHATDEYVAPIEELECFTRHDQLVLYCDKGEEEAQNLRNIFRTLLPNNKMLFGCISLTPAGEIERAFLLKDEESDLQGNSSGTHTHQENFAITNDAKPSSSIVQTNNLTPNDNSNTSDIAQISAIEQHPVYLKLHEIVLMRKQSLQPLAATLNELMQLDVETPLNNFTEAFSAQVNDYLTVSSAYAQLWHTTLLDLRKQYDKLSTEEFEQIIQKIPFTAFMLENTKTLLPDNSATKEVEDGQHYQTIDLGEETELQTSKEV